jgi:hypothetical protein
MRVVPQRDVDRLRHALDVLDHFVVPESQQAKSSTPQIRITTLVV